MFGAATTMGWSKKRSSSSASGTSSKSSPSTACAQKASSRGVSVTPGKPSVALNHCRRASTRLMAEIGTPQIAAAALTMASN
jgi:hypothetical protein